MKKILLTAALAMTLPAFAQVSQTINVQGKEYELIKMLERQTGPGTVYTRYRIDNPSWPQNINVVTVDMNNPYVHLETSIPKGLSAGTERLVDAANRLDGPRHHAIAGQNGNHWCISSEPMWDAFGATTHGINLREGMLAVDSKSLPHWWWWTSELGGFVAVDTDNNLCIDGCKTIQTITSPAIGTLEFYSCNKGFRSGEIGIYTPYFDHNRQFVPLYPKDYGMRNEYDHGYVIDEGSDCTELLLTKNPGSEWHGGRNIEFTVAEVRQSNGRGTIGQYDLAVVARNEPGTDLSAVKVGDPFTLFYGWEYDFGQGAVVPEIDNAVGGNVLVLKNSEITWLNYQDSYTVMNYSRSAYGMDTSRKKLYMIVIDMSNDSQWGISHGTTGAELADIAKALGCNNLMSVDAGGSAQLYVDGRIINRTTEGTPRAVGNGMFVFNTAPEVTEDTPVAKLAFYDVTLSTSAFSEYTPQVAAYDENGTLLTYDYQDFTLSASEGLGTCQGRTLTAGSEALTGTLTATAPNGVSVTKEMTVLAAVPALRLSHIVIDDNNSYLIEVNAAADPSCSINPTSLSWTIDNPAIATVDEDAVIHAVANGQATLTGTLNEYTVTATVSVENAGADFLDLATDWTQWTATGGSGIKDTAMDADGKVTFSYGSVRGTAAITVGKEITVYGRPIAFEVEFTPDMPVTFVDFDIRGCGAARKLVNVTPEEAYPANIRAKVNVPVEECVAKLETAAFPLTFHSIRFSTKHDKAYAGAHTMTVHSIRAIYDENNGVAELPVADHSRMGVYPNPVNAGASFTVTGADPESVEIYSLSGALVGRGNTAPAVCGTYVVRNQDGAALLIVK